MKRSDTPSKPVNRRHSYTKVLDNRKQPIRGLWRRNGNFIARIRVEDELGQKQNKWFPLEATTAAEAQEEMRKLLVERSQNEVRHAGESPKLADYVKTYCDRLEASGKRPATITKEKGCLAVWSAKIGQTRLNSIRPFQVTGVLNGLKQDGLSGRTVNLYMISLRTMLKAAKVDGYLKVLPTIDIPWQKVDTKKRALVTAEELEHICMAALESSKNGQQLVDYLRFLTYSGARRNEALALRWADVDFAKGILTVGADGQTKNREPRYVDLNAHLRTHLESMKSRSGQVSQWLFPSPQRGEKDIPATTFMESLRLARKNAAKKHASLKRFGFHDCRHYFISMCVMAGIDFMTIARWVGHKDGGILIGKVYGHLSNEHAQRQAQRVNFGPTVLEAVAV